MRVKSGYMLFCEAIRAAFKEAHPEAGVVDIMKLMAEAWREAEQQVRCSWTAGGYMLVEPSIGEQVLHACVLSCCCVATSGLPADDPLDAATRCRCGMMTCMHWPDQAAAQ